MNITKIPFKRGTTAQNDAYRGADGEISIDTIKGTIRVHDGVNLGGTELLTKGDLNEFLEGTSTRDRRYQVISPTLVYSGQAVAGSADNAPQWRICRIEINYTTKVVTKTWAGGAATFVNKWTDRAAYSYTL